MKFKMPNLSMNDKKGFYKSIKEGLLNDKITLKQVRDKIIEIDQSTSSREKAEESLEFLLDKDIVSFMEGRTEEEKNEV